MFLAKNAYQWSMTSCAFPLVAAPRQSLPLIVPHIKPKALATGYLRRAGDLGEVRFRSIDGGSAKRTHSKSGFSLYQLQAPCVNLMETEFETPRDVDGHGTHITATAARVTVPGVSYYGVAAGTAQGGSPESRLAIYQVCFKYECPGSAILAAFDDAIADGVDVISVSIGSIPRLRSELKHDPNAIGAFHAVERSILVVASAGNSGPNLNTGVNDGGEAIVSEKRVGRDLREGNQHGGASLL
ncbi:hypothetical protein LR48_Vigan05g169400 [Vigna angularis]|uniref:Peptidase S8/S53 domain-containing protein n=1 Tax=Phaseolus angularis TaxID=3914 RepID=A0A0L9UNI2_PHAAN|nr:hypothetical protein LR48_Vigan05g169400 [Vigna angularis]